VPATPGGSVWTRDLPSLTVAMYAVPLTFVWGVIPAFFLAVTKPFSYSVPWWVLALPAVVLFLSVLWLRQRVHALLELQSLLRPREPASVHDLLTDKTGVRDSLWGRRAFGIVFLGLHSMVWAGIGIPGIYVFISSGASGSEGRVIGSVMVLVAVAGFIITALYPRQHRLIRAALREYIGSGGSNRPALERAAALLAPDIAARRADPSAPPIEQALQPDAPKRAHNDGG
jgi:hypothetical protein